MIMPQKIQSTTKSSSHVGNTKAQSGIYDILLGMVLFALIIVIAAVVFLPKIRSGGETAGTQLTQTTGDDDKDGIPNLLDKCCPAVCKVEKEELLPVAPTDPKYGCTEWQTPMRCSDTRASCGTKPGSDGDGIQLA